MVDSISMENISRTWSVFPNAYAYIPEMSLADAWKIGHTQRESKRPEPMDNFPLHTDVLSRSDKLSI